MVTILAHLIGRPFLILAVALLWGLSALALPRSRTALGANALMWMTFAAWEALVLVLTPEANIRVDLLVISPVLIALALWAVVAVLRQRGS